MVSLAPLAPKLVLWFGHSKSELYAHMLLLHMGHLSQTDNASGSSGPSGARVIHK